MIALFTIFELEQLTDDELEELHYTLSRLLMDTDFDTCQRRNILGSLENIERVLYAPRRQLALRRGF